MDKESQSALRGKNIAVEARCDMRVAEVLYSRCVCECVCVCMINGMLEGHRHTQTHLPHGLYMLEASISCEFPSPT